MKIGNEPVTVIGDESRKMSLSTFLTLTLNVENFFDNKYHDHLRLHEHYLYEPGLNILADLKIEF